MKVDNDGLAIARPRLRATLYGDYHLQWNAGASSRGVPACGVGVIGRLRMTPVYLWLALVIWEFPA